MLICSYCTILDESPFVEGEENHEIYREIYGDPIYDVYEEDVHHIDFIFKEGSFENLSRANFGRDEICEKSVQEEFRAKIGRNRIDEDFVQNFNNLLRANSVQQRICEASSYKQFRAKIVQNMLLKIRGRVFLGKYDGFKDYDQDSRTNLLQPGENDFSGYSKNQRISSSIFKASATSPGQKL
ncbi:Uncharacterized protein Rs2_50301 [Raphanus sativus]|nr:Uncharacterized protein Rs2_50301 [Raphanus sativus]